MKEKARKQVNDSFTLVKETVQGLEDMAIAVALLICAFYNYDTLTADKAPLEYWARLVSSAVIGLFGAWLLVKAVRHKR